MRRTRQENAKTALASAITLLAYASVLVPGLRAQTKAPGTPSITATTKGPDQVNLTWPAVPNPGYGYVVEVQSAGDRRYSSQWTELEPVPTAGGFTCDSSVVWKGGRCNISDPSGAHTYNPPTHGIPYWVTDANYIDPQDGSAAQFIAWGLKPNTSYRFRVRTYSGNKSPVFGAYSAPAMATTSGYSLRYVSPAGDDSNDGTAPDNAHAWRTLSHGTGAITCGQELIVMGGDYANDMIDMRQTCSADQKAVVVVNPGDTAIITSVPARRVQALMLTGNGIVIDGLKCAAVAGTKGEYLALLSGNHDALFNVEFHPPVVPSFDNGVIVYGDHNLLYHSYLHDYGTPDATQNPGGNSGWILAVYGHGATNNVIWSNHLTRGGHDESLCKGGCSYNRWLNNVMDGGWGQGWNAIYAENATSEHNLVEGNFIKDIGQLEDFYKPSIQVSQGNNTIRRNVVVNDKSVALEETYLYGGSAANNLVYNNVFYNEPGCFYQSGNHGATAYDNDVFTNNICYRVQKYAVHFYTNSGTNQIDHNDLLYLDAHGKANRNQAIITWNHMAQGSYQYPQMLSYADKHYSPPFSHNKGLDVVPEFVDESNFDFHLAPGSPLIGAGRGVTDPEWGSTVGKVDLGAFGITVSPPSPAAQTKASSLE